MCVLCNVEIYTGAKQLKFILSSLFITYILSLSNVFTFWRELLCILNNPKERDSYEIPFSEHDVETLISLSKFL